MNYICHLTNFYRQLDEDPRIKPLHISLYLALFQTWNYNFFAHSFIMGRTRLMQLSRIASSATFAKTLRELDEFGYIIYEPSGYTPKKPMITMLEFHDPVQEINTPCSKSATDPVHDLNSPCIKSATDPVPKVEHIDKQLETNKNNLISVCGTHTTHTEEISSLSKVKKKIAPPTKEEVIKWFTERKVDQERAVNFYNHYTAIGWKMGRNEIKDWQAAAEKWIYTTKKQNDHGTSQYLHVDNYKDYGEPL